jgi:hypothetical protein
MGRLYSNNECKALETWPQDTLIGMKIWLSASLRFRFFGPTSPYVLIQRRCLGPSELPMGRKKQAQLRILKRGPLSDHVHTGLLLTVVQLMRQLHRYFGCNILNELLGLRRKDLLHTGDRDVFINGTFAHQ